MNPFTSPSNKVKSMIKTLNPVIYADKIFSDKEKITIIFYNKEKGTHMGINVYLDRLKYNESILTDLVGHPINDVFERLKTLEAMHEI